MNKMYNFVFNKKYQFFRYVIAGFFCVALEIGLFSLSQYLGHNYIVSNTLGFGSASILGYFLQKYWTFHNHSKEYLQEIIRFGLVLAWGYVFGTIVLLIFIEWLGMTIWISKFIQLVCVLISNFLGQKFFTFREEKL